MAALISTSLVLPELTVASCCHYLHLSFQLLIGPEGHLWQTGFPHQNLDQPHRQAAFPQGPPWLWLCVESLGQYSSEGSVYNEGPSEHSDPPHQDDPYFTEGKLRLLDLKG